MQLHTYDLYRKSLWAIVILSILSIFNIVPFVLMAPILILALIRAYMGNGLDAPSRSVAIARKVFKWSLKLMLGAVVIVLGFGFIVSFSNPNIWTEAAPIGILVGVVVATLSLVNQIAAVILLIKDKKSAPVAPEAERVEV